MQSPSRTVESLIDNWLILKCITPSLLLPDIYNCTLVSKSWNILFNPRLWKVLEFSYVQNKQHKKYLLDPTTVAPPRLFELVQELNIHSDHRLPLVHPLLFERDKDLQDPGTIISQKRHHQSPAFPNLKILKWWPLKNRGVEPPPALEMNILDFITAHTTIEYLHLEMMDIETDGVFQRLCDTIEYHPGLKRISVTNNFIHTAEQAQRFIWACRHLQGNEPKLGQRGGGDRSNPGIGPLIRSYRKGHEVDSFDTGTTVRLKSRNIPAYVHNNEERPVSWAPTLAKTTQIRSLCLDHGPYRKFWIFFPVLKMCPWLERLEIKIVELEAMVPALRECLHEACPNLSYLKVMKQEGADEPNKMIQWALGLLCPLIGQQRKIHMPLSAGSALAKFVPIPPYPIGDRLNLDMDLIYGPPPKQPHGKDGNESHCCSGFRLKSLYLQYPWMDCGTLPDIPRPINVLLDHHGPTLVELDLLGIGIALKELSQIAVRVPKLEILRAWIIWSKEHSIYLRDLLRHQKDSDLDIYNDQNDPSPHIDFSSVTTSYASLDRDSVVLTKAGLRPWNCLGLKELEISFVPTQQHLEWPQDSQILKLLLDYLMQEIARLVKLEILGFGSYVPVYHLLTLTEYNNLMDPRGSPILGCGGYLSRFKDLSSLQSVIFKQRDKLRLTVADAEWILEHWPKLNQLKFRCQFKSQEPQLAAQLLRDRKPGLQVDTKY